MRVRTTRVVIIHAHPLLGEGIARLLAEHDDRTVTLLRAEDPQVLDRLHGLCPDVVIFERNGGFQAVDLLDAAGPALLIDVGIEPGPTWTYRREEIDTAPEGLLRAVRQGSARRRVLRSLGQPAPQPAPGGVRS